YLLGRARTPEEIDTYWSPRCADTSGDQAGLGWWVGFAGSEFLGWWDLGRSDSRPEETVDSQAPEIGWRVRRNHWGRGFATESATALLEHGFRTVQAHTIWAQTMAVNRASRRVMEKLGMRHVRTEHRKGYPPIPGSGEGDVFYALTASE